MKIEVELTSEEIIKPSSETPDHLRRYTLSYLDQISPKMYNPLIYFYELKNDGADEPGISEISSRIKKALSEALALYYPLAGRVRKDRFVDCNDEGVFFSEARVVSPNKLSEVIKNPNNPSELSKFLPFEVNKMNEFPAGIQLNTFSGGGVALGICISHQLGDALSFLTFVKSLAALSRGGSSSTTIEKPYFASAELFPPRDDIVLDPTLSVNTKVTLKIFSFASPAIEAIRAKYGSWVSRVEALSVFILSRLLSGVDEETAWTKPERVKERVVMLAHPVNIRQKLDPPLPMSSFGNIHRDAFTIIRGSVVADGGEIAKRIREEIRKVDKEFLEKVRASGEDPNLKRVVEEMRRVDIEGGEFLEYSFNSLCRFPLYDVADFGWGEPAWVSAAALNYDNEITFFDAKRGGGIEAYVSLKPEIMARLEADVEFLKYANFYHETNDLI